MSKHHHQSRVDQINNKEKRNDQEGASDTKGRQEAREVKQAIKNDQSLSDVAGDIHVTVQEGTIILDGQVSTKQQMNLATNTATAVGMLEKVNNRMEIVHKELNNR